MDRRTTLAGAGCVLAVALAGCTEIGEGNDVPDGGSAPPGNDSEPTPDDDPVEFDVETVAEGFTNPWSIAFLPGRQLLVTERDGDLKGVDRDDGSIAVVEGTPDVHTGGQGGMLGLAVSPGFPDERWVYLTYSAANDDGDTTTHLGRGWFVTDGGDSDDGFDDSDDGFDVDLDNPRFEEFEELHAAKPFVNSTQHYGSRVVFGEDGMVYVTVGDRGFKNFGPDHVSQDTANELGATLRLAPDGSIPEDNPFIGDPEVADSIFTYGHRNAQGMAVHPETGEIWQSEHGERDGDEINVVRGGENYGWPVTHYGCEYGTDEPVGDEPHERDDVVPPVYFWECGSGGFPPAGATFYDGDAFEAWRGDLFVGTLAGEFLGRFLVESPGDPSVSEADPVLDDRGWRIRDVAVAPDTGHLYVAVDDSDAPIVRLVPA